MLIEVNLVPGATRGKTAGKRLPSLTLPDLSSLGGGLGAIGGIVAGMAVVGLLGFGYWRLGDQQRALEAQIEQEVTDSTRFAATIALLQSFQARQDTITRKIDLIRSVDTRRFVWPHLLDEISLAVPAFTWISQISSVEPMDSVTAGPGFTIQGNAGSTQALTRFMKNLEASPYVGDVMLVTTEQEVVEGRTIQRFSLEASYRAPDPSLLETYPILALD